MLQTDKLLQTDNLLGNISHLHNLKIALNRFQLDVPLEFVLMSIHPIPEWNECNQIKVKCWMVKQSVDMGIWNFALPDAGWYLSLAPTFVPRLDFRMYYLVLSRNNCVWIQTTNKSI